MSDTTFVPGTVIASTWLNDVNDTVYDLLGDGTLAPVTKADVRTNIGLGNVDDTSDLDKPISTATQTALNLKADIDSPTFTGDPKAPTATLLDSDTTLATTAFAHNVNEGPGFYAKKAAGTTALPAGVATKITFGTTVWTTGQWVSDAFTPGRKGIYTVSANLFCAGGAAGHVVIVSLYKNGVENTRLAQRGFPSSYAEILGGTISMDLLATDVIDVRVNDSAGGTVGVGDPVVSPVITQFSAVFVRDIP